MLRATTITIVLINCVIISLLYMFLFTYSRIIASIIGLTSNLSVWLRKIQPGRWLACCGATFQVPTEIRPDRKESISMKNLILFARKRGGKSMADKLAAEIIDAFNEQGGAYKRKEDMHRMAEANRAFAHFRF